MTRHGSARMAIVYWRATISKARSPRLIAIGGLSGSGKSTVARMLAPRIGVVSGCSPYHAATSSASECSAFRSRRSYHRSAYALEVTDLVYAACRKRAALALEGGQTAIVDAVHAKEDEREALAALAAKMGVAFTGIWLEAPRATLRQRVASRKNDVSGCNARDCRPATRLRSRQTGFRHHRCRKAIGASDPKHASPRSGSRRQERGSSALAQAAEILAIHLLLTDLP